MSILRLLSSRTNIGLVTSSPSETVNIILDLLGISSVFSVVVFADHVSNLKPSPEGYQKAVNLLGLKPSKAIAIEDSQKGIKAARSAGLKVFAVKNLYYADLHDYSSADQVFSDVFVALEKVLLLIE